MSQAADVIDPGAGFPWWVNLLVLIITGLVSGTGGWATLQLVINRRGAKAEAARTEAAAETEREEAAKRKAEKHQLIVDTQRIAQNTATEALNHSLERVNTDLDRCLERAAKVTLVVEDLIDAIVAVYEDENNPVPMPPGVRAALRKARLDL